MKVYWILNTVVVFCISACSQSFSADPLKAAIVTADVNNFWQAFDMSSDSPAKNPFQEVYLDKGTKGLKDFVPEGRIVSADELKKMVTSEREYYASVRSSSMRIKTEYEKQIRSVYFALKYWYPKAVFPPLYFVVGRTTSGGTASGNGLIIAAETFAEHPQRTKYGRPSFPSDYIPFIVAHEVVHFLQGDEKSPKTLLSESVKEGAADFIGELIAGTKVTKLNGEDLYAYGNAHENELWTQFMAERNSSDFPEWLYGQTKSGRPQNLGYWIGYKIAQCHFEKATDKKAAFQYIVKVRNYERFVQTATCRPN